MRGSCESEHLPLSLERAQHGQRQEGGNRVSGLGGVGCLGIRVRGNGGKGEKSAKVSRTRVCRTLV